MQPYGKEYSELLPGQEAIVDDPSSRLLRDAQNEIEQTVFQSRDVLIELDLQEERLGKISNRMDGINLTLGNGKRVITSMTKRDTAKNVIAAGCICLIIFFACFILYWFAYK